MPAKKIPHQSCNFPRLFIQRKMPRLQYMNFGIGQIPSISLGLGNIERRIKLAPHH
ncbi:hypothetical protein D3C72_2457310 [compost metagenome]